MPKKDSSKSPGGAVSEKKPSSTMKKQTNEIDDMFSAKKRKESPVVVPEKKHSPTSKKSINEIDEIFSTKKRKKCEEVKVAEVAAALKSGKRNPELTKMKKESGSRSREFADLQTRARKKTGDGLVIYTEDELGIGKSDAGGTRLCPFDCECCF